jgi:hypothetical protein
VCTIDGSAHLPKIMPLDGWDLAKPRLHQLRAPSFQENV